MDAAGRRPGPTRGFTLVELLTVVAIIAILMSLVVGAFTSVRARYQRDATLEVFRAIEAALQQYYSDWGMYPWPNDATAECEIDDPSKPSRKIKIMGKVDNTLNPALNFGGDLEKQAILFAALTARVRNGPYMGGATPLTMEVKTVSSNKTYACMVFADGWGHPILYGPPVSGAPVSGVSAVTLPRLESKGANEGDKQDNVKNYNYTNSLEDIN
jgi:prepilin-type N-terminal cleavage/methylation domain-containing protein